MYVRTGDEDNEHLNILVLHNIGAYTNDPTPVLGVVSDKPMVLVPVSD